MTSDAAGRVQSPRCGRPTPAAVEDVRSVTRPPPAAAHRGQVTPAALPPPLLLSDRRGTDATASYGARAGGGRRERAPPPLQGGRAADRQRGRLPSPLLRHGWQNKPRARSTAPAAVRRGRETSARAGPAQGRCVVRTGHDRQRVTSRRAAWRTTNPRQYSPLRWVKSLSLQIQCGRGRAVAAGAVGSEGGLKEGSEQLLRRCLCLTKENLKSTASYSALARMKSLKPF